VRRLACPLKACTDTSLIEVGGWMAGHNASLPSATALAV